MTTSLVAFRDPFKDVVLRHIRKVLAAHEWHRFRALASNRRRFVDPQFVIEEGASAATIIDLALSEESISVEETLIGAFKAKAVEIGEIAGQPVRYISSEGVYIWGLEPSEGFTLSFWATFPAYPPSW